MRWLTIAVALAAFALVGAGCGGGDDESAADTDTVAVTDTAGTDETTTDETTTDETTEDTDTDASGGFPSADCLQAVTAFGVLAQAAAGAAGVDAGDSLQQFEEFADSAPDEIEGDIRVLADAYATYIQTLSDLGLAQGEVPDADQIQALEQASASFATPEFEAASQNWDAWIATNCPQ